MLTWSLPQLDAREADASQRPLGAGEVAKAVDAGDMAVVRRAALQLSPDAWLLASSLLTLGREDVAKVVARHAPAKDKAALTVALSRVGSVEAARVRREATAALLAGRDLQALGTHLEALESADPLLLVHGALAWDPWDPNDYEAERMDLPVKRVLLALKVARELGWSRAERRLALLASDASFWVGDVEEARAHVTPVLGLRDRERADPLDADVLTRMGSCAAGSGAHSTSRTYFLDAAEIHEATGDAVQSAFLRSNAGVQLVEYGRLEEAYSIQRRCEAALRELQDRHYLPHVVRRVAGAFEMAGRLDRAVALLKRLVREAPEGGETRALALANLSRAQFLGRDAKAALATIASAQMYFGAEGRRHRSKALNHMAWYAASVGPRDVIANQLEAALGEDWPSPRDRVSLLEGLGRVRMGDKAYSQAVAAFTEAKREASRLEAGASVAIDANGQLGWARSQAGDHAGAKAALDEYVRGLVGHVSGAEGGSSRTFRGIVLDDALKAGIRSALATKDLPSLWRYMEAGRGIRLLAALGGKTSLDERIVPPALVAALKVAQAKETAAQVQYRAALQAPVEPGEAGPTPRRVAIERARALRDERIFAAEEASRRIRESLARSDQGELTSSTSIRTLSETATLLPKDVAIVALSLAGEPDEVLALVVTRKKTWIRRLGRRTVIVEGATSTFGRLGARGLARQEQEGGTNRVSLEAMREALVKPLRLPATIRTVHVIPDGVLAYLPYAALFGGRDVSVVPSGTVLGNLERERSGTARLALGNPDYSGKAIREQLALLDELVAEEGQGTYLDLDALHATQGEAETAAGNGLALTKANATVARFKKELAEAKAKGVRFATIHFACHGIIHADSPMLSGLALTDGLLRAHDVLTLPLDTDLVVLAACETATDTYVSGEGISGLVRAFLFAGAPRVLATLWRVPDEQSAVLMKHFYATLDEEGSTVATALRKAQAAVRTRWPDPYYWAGWTLWGVP